MSVEKGCSRIKGVCAAYQEGNLPHRLFLPWEEPLSTGPNSRMKHRASLKAVVSKGRTGGRLLPIKGHLRCLDSWTGDRDAGTGAGQLELSSPSVG